MEYLRYAYNNAFRYPKRLITLIIAVALAIFGILSIVSVTTNLQRMNDEMIIELENNNINTKQLYIKAQTLDAAVNKELLSKVNALTESESGYYFEKFSDYLWRYSYLFPWFEIENKINLELDPILLDTSAKEYGLADKIIYGRYFSDDPNEIILSVDLLQGFINKQEVFHTGEVVLTDSERTNLKKGGGEIIDPEDILGKSIDFTYDALFGIETDSNNKVLYTISETESLSLKVVGIFDPNVGYQTIGDSWIPLSIKEEFVSKNSKFAVYNPANVSLSGQIAIRAHNPTLITGLKQNITNMGYIAVPTVAEDVYVKNQITQQIVYKNLYQLALYSAIAISLVSLIVMITLIVAERKYDFILQRTLGAGNKQLYTLFVLELLITTLIGSLSGLWLTLVFLQTGLDKLIGLSYYLNGSIAALTIGAVPLLTVIIGILQLKSSFKSIISVELARGE